MSPLISADDLQKAISRAADAVDAAASAYAVDAADLDGGRLLRYYILFSDDASLTAAGLNGLAEDTLFYNRYYWFKKFLKRHGRAVNRAVSLDASAADIGQ